MGTAMPKFIVSALPGLLLGTILGFGIARLGGDDDDEAATRRDNRLAKVCMNEARKVLATTSTRAPREQRGPSRPASDADRDAMDPAERAARTIETALKRARKDKKWTIRQGEAAERHFPRLSPETADQLTKKILSAVEGGEVTAEHGAWLPTKKE